MCWAIPAAIRQSGLAFLAGYILRKGEGTLEVDGIRQKLEVGDQAVIPAGASQRIENTGEFDLEFYCLCVPRFYPANYVNLED